MTYPSAALATAADRLSLDFELGHMNDIASREERGDYRLACDHLDRAYPCAENLRRQPLATTPKAAYRCLPARARPAVAPRQRPEPAGEPAGGSGRGNRAGTNWPSSGSRGSSSPATTRDGVKPTSSAAESVLPDRPGRDDGVRRAWADRTLADTKLCNRLLRRLLPPTSRAQSSISRSRSPGSISLS